MSTGWSLSDDRESCYTVQRVQLWRTDWLLFKHVEDTINTFDPHGFRCKVIQIDSTGRRLGGTEYVGDFVLAVYCQCCGIWGTCQNVEASGQKHLEEKYLELLVLAAYWRVAPRLKIYERQMMVRRKLEFLLQTVHRFGCLLSCCTCDQEEIGNVIWVKLVVLADCCLGDEIQSQSTQVFYDRCSKCTVWNLSLTCTRKWRLSQRWPLHHKINHFVLVAYCGETVSPKGQNKKSPGANKVWIVTWIGFYAATNW